MSLVVNHATKSSASKPVAVSVNGVVIPRDAITREIQNHPAPRPADAWHDAARALVVRELLLQEAARLGIVAEAKSDSAGRRETDEEALMRGLVEHEIKTPEPDDEVCRRYYAQHLSRFSSADIYEAAHILLAACQDDETAFAKARRQGEAVLADLRRCPELFGEFAALHSACPSGAQGGNLGQVTAGQTTPEFEKALLALAPGSIGDKLVPTRYGLHIVRLDRKIEGRQLPFELVAERIGEYLKDGVVRRATAQYIALLVSRATVSGIPMPGAEAHRVN